MLKKTSDDLFCGADMKKTLCEGRSRECECSLKPTSTCSLYKPVIVYEYPKEV